VLDVFAGTGAFGLEALSRGATHAVFIEHDRALDSEEIGTLSALCATLPLPALPVGRAADYVGGTDVAGVASSAADHAGRRLRLGRGGERPRPRCHRPVQCRAAVGGARCLVGILPLEVSVLCQQHQHELLQFGRQTIERAGRPQRV
jgi:hypothetical protein